MTTLEKYLTSNNLPLDRYRYLTNSSSDVTFEIGPGTFGYYFWTGFEILCKKKKKKHFMRITYTRKRGKP